MASTCGAAESSKFKKTPTTRARGRASWATRVSNEYRSAPVETWLRDRTRSEPAVLLKSLAQHRARRVLRVREVDDVHPELTHLLLESHSLRRSAPVIALEDDVEVALFPGQRLVLAVVQDHLVDDAERRHDVDPLIERN